MTIKDVCAMYHIAPDTLRYYERVGAIPAVNRTGSGIRDYTEEGIGWVDMMAEYVKLCQQGDETFPARRDLLKKAREKICKQIEKCQTELRRLAYKIERYEAAVETGQLVWDRPACPPNEAPFEEERKNFKQ